MAAAGFTNLEIVTTRTYDFTDERGGQFLSDLTAAERQALHGALISAFIRAKKPTAPLTAGTDYTLRPAQADDLAAVERLLTASGLPTAGVADHLATFFVAEADGVAGVIGLELAGENALLRSLAVAGEQRKRGLGSALFTKALDQARQAGATTAYLLTNTAEQFVARWSFAPISRDDIPTGLLTASALATACPTSSACLQKTL
ncbi:arsenic resistance N-acetyltransferase ArsN2 [Sporomusa sphaeroides]|uniref:arsenic resistance N-acetyltransferase ArsN2 n=1 Tax=Sporomusa sphaeroides TaxID=47679 RepID=UPI002C57F817|nr:arsenic resistance N-acetyltransferase ArsN2 [Sporomusa sphaeroides]HML35206.1 arsenic resistance N-acetyltransferase ArsN2 [Sporomusa sphaeroides]